MAKIQPNFEDYYCICHATPTSRLMDNGEEWVESVECNGREYNRYYIFSDDEEFYPFDADHVSKILEL